MIAYSPYNPLVQKAIFRPSTRKLTYHHYTDKFINATNGTFCQLWSHILSSENTDECISIDYQSSKQNNISDNQVSTINQLLYLLDHFAVSDELHHELSMVFPLLPRSHIVRRVRKHLSENVAIHRLPDPFFGAYRHLSHSLTEAIEALVSRK